MRFLCIYKPSVNKAELGIPPTQTEIAEMGQLIDEMTRAGVLLSTEGCQGSAKGARVRLSSGKLTVIDGPFTEAKEIVGGFAIIRVASRAEAVEWTERFLKVAGDGECEIRQLHEQTDFEQGAAAERGAQLAQK